MEISTELADRVMRLVVSADYRPSKPKQIAAKLKLDPKGFRELRRVIKQLVLEGRLVYGSNHLVFSTGSVGGPSDKLRGTFRRARGSGFGSGGGFGFVRLNSDNEKDSEPVDDLFVPPGKTGGALEGDLVEVAVKPSRKGGNEGVVVQILERARRQFTGTFQFTGNQPVVFLDGTHYEHPVSVGDVRGLPLDKGDKVFVELVEYPDDDGNGGEAVILERLGLSLIHI